MHLLSSKWHYETAGDVKVYFHIPMTKACQQSPPHFTAHPPPSIFLSSTSLYFLSLLFLIETGRLCGAQRQRRLANAPCHLSFLAPEAAWLCPKHMVLIAASHPLFFFLFSTHSTHFSVLSFLFRRSHIHGRTQ